MKRLGSVLISALIFMLVAMVLPGVVVDTFWTALWATLILVLINSTIGFLLKAFLFPLNFLTLGLVNFFINGAVMLMVAGLLDGLEIASWFVAAILALIFSALNTFITDK